MNIEIAVTSLQITSGDDAGMPRASLYRKQHVTYQLDADAALKFKFKPEAQAITLVDASGNLLDHVDLKRTDSSLRVTIKDKAPVWTSGKATLFFDPLGTGSAPAVGGLDPLVDNGGNPP